MSQVLTASFDGCGSTFRGVSSRELLTQLTGRPPVWAPLSRGWSCQADTLADAVALAESMGREVVIVGRTDRRAAARAALLAAPAPTFGGD